MLIIGERINPASKPALAFALREGRTTLIQQEVIAQERSGAQALDVNVYLSDIDRAKIMREVVETIRFISQIPLLIDDRDPVVVESGLKEAGSNRFINSPIDVEDANAKIFSLVQKFKTDAFVLPLAQNRIPENFEEHIRLSHLLVKRFEENGVPRKHLVIDAMLLTLKQAKSGVVKTLETIKRLKEELGVRTVMGLSNISYGLKNREKLNSRFLKLARGCGLDAVICDPVQKEVMNAASGDVEIYTELGVKKFLEFAETC